MSEWIESHVTLPRNKKFRRLCRSLGTSVPETLGLLHALWYYTAEQAPSGCLEGHTAEDIAEGCYFAGDPESFLQALIECGWVDEGPEGLQVHDWVDYNRQYRERQRAALRQAEKRRRDSDPSESNGDVTVTSRPTDRQTRQTEKTDREEEAPAGVPLRGKASREGDWVALWVDAERAAGREPAKSAKAIFGRKVKEIPRLDPLVMADALTRMTEEEKPPGTLALVYGDCLRAAEREVFAVQTGGRARVR